MLIIVNMTRGHDHSVPRLTSGVPHEMSLKKLPLSPICHLLANPKSTNTGTSLYDNMTFAGLISLCVIPLSWRYPTAEHNCRKYGAARSGERQTGIKWDK